jgi:hypothetical protein
MARVAKPRSLGLTVSASAEGIPFISNVDFCSPDMSLQWGRTFMCDINLSESQEPTVHVFFTNMVGDLIEIQKSPFTGGDIVVSVDEKAYDTVVAALLALSSPTDEDVPQVLSEDVDDGYEDEDVDQDEGFEDEEDAGDEDDGLEDEEDADFEDEDDEYEDEEEDD